MPIQYFGKEPDGITGEELRDYFLYRKNECGWAQNTMKICSCGNRHCPVCQHRKARERKENQLKKVLPGHHFMVTLTVPEQLRDFIRSHQKSGCGAMFTASPDSMKKLSSAQSGTKRP